MKHSSLFAGMVIAGALVAVSFATPGAPLSAAEQLGSAGQGGDPQKDARAAEIEALRQKNDALALELADTQHALEGVLEYLKAQQESALDMESVLDDAEKKGFAVGENWASRVALLGGWRAQIDAARMELPTLEGAKAKPANGATGGPVKTPPKN